MWASRPGGRGVRDGRVRSRRRKCRCARASASHGLRTDTVASARGPEARTSRRSRGPSSRRGTDRNRDDADLCPPGSSRASGRPGDPALPTMWLRRPRGPTGFAQVRRSRYEESLRATSVSCRHLVASSTACTCCTRHISGFEGCPGRWTVAMGHRRVQGEEGAHRWHASHCAPGQVFVCGGGVVVLRVRQGRSPLRARRRWLGGTPLRQTLRRSPQRRTPHGG